MNIKATQDIIASLAKPISSAPDDGTIIFVFLPPWRYKRDKRRAMWVRAKWVEDHREERAPRRHDLMMKHDGYWAHAKADGARPLHCLPTHWLPEFPILETTHKRD